MPTKKRAAKTASDTATKSVRSNMISTRFEVSEMECVEKAAAVSRIPVAAFVRGAAVRRAVDVLNADGAQQHLYPVAREIVRHLITPKLRLGMYRQGYDDGLEYEESDSFIAMRDGGGDDRPYECDIVRPDRATLEQAQQALETCGSEFARLLLECWDAAVKGEGGYIPKYASGDSPSATSAKGDSDAERSIRRNRGA